MIELSHIYKTFEPGTVNESVLFTDFNLSIHDDDFISVIGSNGSGKTTMLNLLCGSLVPDKGQIIRDGQDITKMKEYRRSEFISRVYQDPSKGSCPSFSILENIALADTKGKSFNLHLGIKKDRIDYYRTLLETLKLGLENRLDDKVGSLSGGQRQALAMLTSTLTPTSLMILDEHTAALDPKTADNIMELTDHLVHEKKLTTLMVTHNLKFALQYGNRLIMMHQGKAIIDVAGEEKKNLPLSEILNKFNEISLEYGNSL